MKRKESLREKIAIMRQEYERKHGEIKTQPIRQGEPEPLDWRTKWLVNLDLRTVR